MATARANARMALMIAIGELQKELGPDQRVSGTADLAGAADGTFLAAGAAPGNNTPPGGTSGTKKGLTSVQRGTRYWTGVWANSNTTNPGTLIYTKTPTPLLRKWLISGNEGTIANGSGGYDPANQDVMVESDGSVSNTKKAVVLVGKGTVGEPASDTLDRYVSAPLVEIGGNDATSRNPAGRHAWWIGDEGVKAKLNLATPFSNSSDATYASLSAQRRGWEAVDGFGNYPTPGSGGQDNISKLISIPQAALFDPALQGGGGVMMGRAFHGATSDSYGVLTDPVQGGLKLDLSAYLNSGFPGSAPPGIVNGPSANGNLIPLAATNRNMKGPKWNRLTDFHELGKQAKSSNKLTTKPAANTNDSAIAPIIADFRVIMGVRFVRGSGNNFLVQPCAKIAVSLANPYPYTLEWGSGLDIEVKNDTISSLFPSRIYERKPDGGGLWATENKPAYLDATRPAVFSRALFRIPAGSLPAGEARAYGVSSQVRRPASGSITTTVVNMGPFSSSGPQDFNNCVILESTTAVDFGTMASITLDVRENTNTSQATVELRPAGASTILRRIERFEFDNAPFNVTARTFTAADAARFTQPVPLQYYGYQISQPGERYDTMLPAADQMGLRNSTLRTFTDFNLQATRFRKPIISYTPPPYYMSIANSRAALGEVPGSTGPEFSRNLLADPLPWGHSHFAPSRTVLFSPPADLVSIGQLQHADLTGDDIYASVAHQPGNAVGNSYASPFVKRQDTKANRMDFNITGISQATQQTTTYYDISYLLNAALWDTYFLSTIPASGSSVPLNPTMVKLNASDESSALKNAEEVAGHLLVNGSHNVNCTNKDAWKALLASSKHLKHPAATGSDSDAIFPRSLEQLAAPSGPPTGKDEDSFAGYRKLSDAQLDAVATELVRQVRLRGPFVSLSQFVNRSLVTLTQGGLHDPKMLGRSGPLQAALDISGMNISPDGSKNPFTQVVLARERLNLQSESVNSPIPRADLVGTDTANFPTGGGTVWPTGSYDENPGSVAGILADTDLLSRTATRPEQGFRSTGIPSWLTQADLLQVLGPVLSARSDTFRIRAYGEALDAETGNPVARAWCEAVVQRVPEYVDGSNVMTERPGTLTAVNQRFGRRFKTVSFKWLSPDEI